MCGRIIEREREREREREDVVVCTFVPVCILRYVY
jgi:hypothetical protein